ncbi:MAG: hypothetical protein Q7S79_02540 [bacterium]|nr:hypothetical protein [bacterium]
MLIGSYVQRIDIKGRTAVPFRFKKELGTEVILARWYEKCLAIFALNDWEEMIHVATSGGILAAPARDTERFLLGGACGVNLDAQGRFVIPQALRAHSALEGAKEVVFVGLNRRVEVWSKESWQSKEKEIVNKAEELIEKVRKSNKV